MQLDGPDYPAPAKLNLFLHVLGRRADGYHLIQSVFALVDAADRLRFAVRGDGEIRRVNDLPGVPDEADLVVRAARLLQAARRERAWGPTSRSTSGCPWAAGWAAGAPTPPRHSSRSTGCGGPASTARPCRPWGPGWGRTCRSSSSAATRGSRGWARGSSPIDLPEAWYLVLVPPVAVPTGEIFAAPELTRDTEPLKMEDFSAHVAPGRFRNDLEAVVAARYPAVREHLEWLARHGGGRLTGSGSCVFARFEDRESAERVRESLPGSMEGFVARGLREHPLRGL